MNVCNEYIDDKSHVMCVYIYIYMKVKILRLYDLHPLTCTMEFTRIVFIKFTSVKFKSSIIEGIIMQSELWMG